LLPIVLVVFQLAVLSWTYLAGVRHSPSLLFKAAYIAAFCGVIGMDIWYFANFAYPTGWVTI